MAKKPKVSDKELAEQYGWAYSFLQSIPELKRLFKKAVADQWTPNRFQAALRGTSWWRHNSDTFKANQALKATDPATYKQRLTQTTASVKDMAARVGAFLTPAQLKRISANAFNFAWTESQLRDVLAASVDNYFTKFGTFGGEAADAAEQLRGLALGNGVKVSDDTLQNWMIDLVGGDQTTEGLEQKIRELAISAFPGFADDLRAGRNMIDIASPYIESYAQILEKNPAEIDLFNPTIRKALQPQADASGNLTQVSPLWQFEREVKKDPAWFMTKNARESLLGIGHRVLKDFGFMGV